MKTRSLSVLDGHRIDLVIVHEHLQFIVWIEFDEKGATDSIICASDR